MVLAHVCTISTRFLGFAIAHCLYHALTAVDADTTSQRADCRPRRTWQRCPPTSSPSRLYETLADSFLVALKSSPFSDCRSPCPSLDISFGMGPFEDSERFEIFLRSNHVCCVIEIRFVGEIPLLEAKLQCIRSAFLQCKERLTFPYSLLISRG